MKESLNDDDLFKALASMTKMDGLANFDPNVSSTLFDVDTLLEEDGFSGHRRKAVPSSYGSKASSSRMSLCGSSARNSGLSWLDGTQPKTKKDLKSIGEDELTQEGRAGEKHGSTPPSRTTKPTVQQKRFTSNLDDILGEMDELTNTQLPKGSESESDSISNMFGDRMNDESEHPDSLSNMLSEQIENQSDQPNELNDIEDEDDLENIEAALDDLELNGRLSQPVPEAYVCRACGEAISSGPACKIAKGVYHVDHFACVVCNGSLLNKPFYERLDMLYCINDYIKKFAHLCEVCKEPVLNDIILSLGLYYHIEHFKCRICNEVIGDQPYHLVNKVQHCVKCFEKLFSKACERCGKTISSNHVSVQGKFWHGDCFKCQTCGGTLANGAFQLYKNQLYCTNDYHRLQGTICLTCNQPIIGRCVQSKGRYYHAEHFVCNLCKTPLASKTYKILKDREYCTACYDLSYME